jgi:hypothetical protein
MPELWDGLTVAQAIVIVAAAWVLVQLSYGVTGLARRIFGFKPADDDSDHTAQINLVVDLLTEVRDHLHDASQYLDRVDDNTGATLANALHDQTNAIHQQGEALKGLTSAMFKMAG